MDTFRRAAVGFLAALLLGSGAARGDEPKPPPDAPAPAPDAKPDPRAARDAGLAWLAANPNPDGSWGKSYTVAITGLACLARLAASDEPYEGERAKPLVRGLEWLLAAQKDGLFPQQGHTWIHGQGFATLALSEAYGRALLAKAKPDLDLKRLKAVVRAAVTAIEAQQSSSGGWWYTPGSPGQHEGSTTVCAVQALVSAANFGFGTDERVLTKGFEYLKRCQNPDGGFDYMEGPGTDSMKEGTAAGVATLALMKKFDYEVMVQGTGFLKKIGAAAISAERFPYYGHFYACMGMRLFGEEMGATEAAEAYTKAAWSDLLSWREKDGSWPARGWIAQNGEGAAYATAFAALILSVPETRLSIFRRTPPELPPAPWEGPGVIRTD